MQQITPVKGIRGSGIGYLQKILTEGYRESPKGPRVPEELERASGSGRKHFSNRGHNLWKVFCFQNICISSAFCRFDSSSPRLGASRKKPNEPHWSFPRLGGRGATSGGRLIKEAFKERREERGKRGPRRESQRCLARGREAGRGGAGAEGRGKWLG